MKQFVDDYIFNEFKDVPLNGTHNFIKKVKDKYDVIPDSDLYRRIINYQIREYGMTLFNHRPSYKAGTNNFKSRHRNSLNATDNKRLQSFIKRNSRSEQNDIKTEVKEF